MWVTFLKKRSSPNSLTKVVVPPQVERRCAVASITRLPRIFKTLVPSFQMSSLASSLFLWFWSFIFSCMFFDKRVSHCKCGFPWQFVHPEFANDETFFRVKLAVHLNNFWSSIYRMASCRYNSYTSWMSTGCVRDKIYCTVDCTYHWWMCGLLLDRPISWMALIHTFGNFVRASLEHFSKLLALTNSSLESTVLMMQKLYVSDACHRGLAVSSVSSNLPCWT